MTVSWNIICTTLLASLVVFYLIYLFWPKEVKGEKRKHSYDINDLVEEIRRCFNDLLNRNMAMSYVKEDKSGKRERLRLRLKQALRTCSYGNLGEKEFIKDYIKDLLQKRLKVTSETIDEIFPFEEPDKLTIQDKFEIVLYLYKQRYGYHAMEHLMEEFHLDRGRIREDGMYYEITEDDIEECYWAVRIPLVFPEKLDILAQRIYQIYKGHGVIDELKDMKVDGLSGGVCGKLTGQYDYMEELLHDRPTNPVDHYRSIWMFYHGKNIHLKFLSFGSQMELERICKNIYRYNHPGQLSAVTGYKVNDLYDGSRVVVVRPPFAESWAFFLRKFDNLKLIKASELVTGEGAIRLLACIRWMIKGCQVIAVTGEQGCGKTTMLKALVEYINPSYTLRIQELVFETHLRNLYPDRNIITFRETEEVSGQEALDLQKKTDGVVNILGEVASAPLAAWIVQLSQVGTKMTMFTNHALTTRKLVEYFRNSLLSVGLFRDEKIAEKQVVDAIGFDIHMEKDQDGNRYIERISEILPLEEGEKANYKVVDLYRYEEGRYRELSTISMERRKNMLRNLTSIEKREFEEFLQEA